MRAEVGTENDDGSVTFTNEEAVFTMCVALTGGIDLPEADAPVWSLILADFLKDKSYLADPVGRWLELEIIAPDDLFTQWWSAYNGTRPVELMAAPELQPGAAEDSEGEAQADPTAEAVGA
jgi:hypothetical protein